MASKRKTTSINGRSSHFLNIGNSVSRKTLVDSLLAICQLEGLELSVIDNFRGRLEHCISVLDKYTRLKSNKTRKEFRDACKRHQKQLDRVLSVIVNYSKESTEDLLSISINKQRVTVKSGTFTIMDEDITPRSFISWYKILNIFDSIRHYDSNTHIIIARTLSSVYALSNEFVLNQSEKDEQALGLIQNLSGKPKFTISDDYITDSITSTQYTEGIMDIKETITLIKHYCDNDRLAIPSWCSQIVRAIRRLRRDNRLLVYDNTRPMLSFNSTCSQIKSKNKWVTLPGVFASVVEEDYYSMNNCNNMDDIIGFNQSYKVDDLDLNTRSHRRQSVVIDQKKPKVRVIHPLNNSEQDRLLFVHNIAARCLRSMNTDCTFDQQRGPRHIRETMKNTSNAVYSLDLTAATDTFNVGLQKLIVEELLLSHHEHANIIADSWFEVMTSKSRINISGKEIEFSFSNGQPQGFLSSFPVFALEHHIIMMTLLRKLEISDTDLSFYRVLGDDGLITCYDPDTIIPERYSYYMQCANVECNTDKGYLYNQEDDRYQVKIAEFAKYLIMDGDDITPIPTKLLCTNYSINNIIGLFMWYSQHNNHKMTIDNLLFFVNKLLIIPGRYDNILRILSGLKVPGGITRSVRLSMYGLFEHYTRLDLRIVQDILLHSMVYSTIDKLVGIKPLDLSIDTLTKFSSEVSPIMEAYRKGMIPSTNKLSFLFDRIIDYASVLSETLKSFDSFSDLSQDDIDLICLYLQSNNDSIVKDDISQLFDSLELLLIDPDDLDDSEVHNYTTRILSVYNNFSICIDRSWSSLSRKYPLMYLDDINLHITNSLVEEGVSVDEYTEQVSQGVLARPASNCQVRELPNESDEFVSIFDLFG